MVAHDSPNVNCAYVWANHVTSPEVQAQIAEWFGEAPGNEKACDLTADKNHCDTFHAGTPRTGRTSTTGRRQPRSARTDERMSSARRYADWKSAWDEVRGRKPTSHRTLH